MVKSITSLTGSGLKDWYLQRISAIVLTVYLFFLLGFVCSQSSLTYQSWSSLFAESWMKYFTLLAMLSLIVHAWIGIWTVLTDYVKVNTLRALLQLVFVLGFFTYLVWTIRILWGF